MDYQFIKTDNRDGVFILTMHDPPTRNALGSDMAREIMEALNRFENDPDERVLLMTGTEPSFCSGANVRGFNQRVQEREDRDKQGQEPADLTWGKMEARLARPQGLEADAAQVPLRLHQLQKPSVAAVNGHAMGVGMGVALACDIRIAAEKAQFSKAFVRMGVVPGDGSCWQLPRLIGLGNALLLQYTGNRIDGNEAYRIGLVSKVVPDDAIMRPSWRNGGLNARGGRPPELSPF